MTEDLHKLMAAALLEPGGDAPVEALARRGRARRVRRRAAFAVVPVLALVAGLLTGPELVGQRVELAPAEQGGDGAGWPVIVRYEQVDVNYFELAQLPEMLTSVPLEIQEFAGSGWQQWTSVGVASHRVDEALIGAPDGSPRAGIGEPVAPEASAQVTHFDGPGGRSGSLAPDDHVTPEPDVAFATLAAARQVEPEWTPEEADGPRGVGPFFAPADFFTGPANREAGLEQLPWPGYSTPDVDGKQLLREQIATALGLDAGDLSVVSVDVPYCVADGVVGDEDCAANPNVEWIRYTFVRHSPTGIPLFRHWAGPDVDNNADALQVTQLRVTHIDLSADEQATSPFHDQTATVDPVALVGLWEVLDAGEPAGAILRLDVRSVRLFRDCGAIFGDWDADHDGLFVADGGSWSGECAAAGDDPTPAWLLTAAAHRPDGDGHVLLDVDGSVVARLVPGEEPTLPPTILQSQAAPPVVTDQTRRQLAPAEPLPANTAPADGRTPLGRWTPTDAPEGSESHVRFGTDAAWNGSDGCNGLDGRWRAGSDGALLATGTGMTRLIGCESIAVETRLTRAARAGFDGDTLVLYDRQGAELGRFEPSDGAAALEPHTDEALNRGDLPPVDAETAAAQRARFAEAIGEDYDATVLVRCICPSTAPVRIEVRGGVLTRATRAPGAEQEDVARGAGSVGVPTVDGIHGILERIAAERGGRVRARYDDRGVPLRAEVDHRADAVDDEVTYLVTDVVAAADPS